MSDKDYLIKGEMYQYNLGWLIKELMSFKQDLATAIDLKTIKYADPIQWDITTQYPANTVVIDPKSGTAYMSKVPVPAGVELKNTNYWVVVFNYQYIYNKIMDGVAFNDRDQDYATKDLLANDLVWYAGDLYRATREIPSGSKYIPGTNLIKTTIESLLARYYGRDRMAQVSNDTVNVSGDYTLIAGDIAETSTNRTVKVTKDREVDVDGSDSVHVDGASTLNVGGLRTEVYAGDKTEGVAGAYTGEFGSASFETKAPSWLVKFPGKTVDLADIHKSVIRTVKDYGAKGDGVTDDTAAIKTCINNESLIYFPAGTYRVTETLTLDDKHMCGENKAKTFLRMDGDETLINAGSRTQINDITLGFFNADGAGYGEKIAINCMGSQYALQRTSISNVNIWICGTAIKSGAQPFFSVNFDTMEITEFTYAAVQISTPDSTQNAFRNLYITSSKNPDYMFIVYTRISSIYIENLNLEHTVPKNDPFILNGYLTAYINGIQFEGVTLTQNVGLITLNGKYAVIDRLTNIFNTLDPNSEYGIMMRIGKCGEFGDFTTSDMTLLNQSSTIIINSYTQWGFNFNGKALTFARRDESELELNMYINGFGGVAYSAADIAKYDIYVQAPDSTNVFKDVNPHYGAPAPTKFLTKSQLFYDTADNKLKYYNGTAWVALQNEQA